MRALITGSGGQDGSYLYDLLSEDGWDVCGLTRRSLVRNGQAGTPVDLEDAEAVNTLIKDFRPHRIFHLAAYHHSSEQGAGNDLSVPRKSLRVHVDALLNLLEGVARLAEECRLFYAGSSHVFGDPAEAPQTEDTPFDPKCPYGISKATGIGMCRLFRDRYSVFASAGILFNHESPRRPPHFLIPSIVRQGLAVQRGAADAITVGALDARVDWGYAPEYVDAMRRILEIDRPADFVIASGRLHSVRDVVNCVNRMLNLPASTAIREDATRLAKSPRRNPLVGDAGRLTAATGWRPATGLEGIVGAIIKAGRTDA